MKEHTDKAIKPTSRSFGLDILRAAAIVAVIFDHEVTKTGIPILEGMDGVGLFFVISGFLVGRIYFRDSRKASFKILNFWGSRWWRTLPPYAAAILLYVIVRHTTSSLAPVQPQLPWWYALFLQNYLGITGFGVTWSLCVQEHFYLTLPLLGMAMTRMFGRRSFLYALPPLFFVPWLLRYLTMLHGFPPNWYFRSHLHCEGLIAGVWLAYLSVDERPTLVRVRRFAPWFALTLPVIFYFAPHMHAMWWQLANNTFIALGFAGLVCCLMDFGWDPVSALGRGVHWMVQLLALTSYSIYLVHTTVDPVLRGIAVKVLHMNRGAARTLFVIGGIFVIGEVFSFCIERPTILLRNRMMHHAPEQTLPSPVEASVV